MNKQQWFNDIYDKYKVQLLNYAISVTKDRHLAEDVVQFVFMQLWKQDQDKITSVAPWLYVVCRHNIAEYYRKKNNRHVIWFDINIQDSYTGFEKVDSTDYAQHVLNIVRLSDTQKEVLALWMNGYSRKEMAETLNLKCNHIRLLLHRALKKVKHANPR